MRFVSGLPHGAFFGVGSIVAERVADKGKRAEAVSIMVVGMTVANLFGVPLGTYISGAVTWRATFGIVAVWGAVAMLLVKLWVPALPALPDTGLKGQFRFLKSAAPWLVLASVMLGNGGIFCWYSYVSPLMIHTSGFRPDDLTLIIMLAGFGMFAGNIIGGHYADRFTPEKVVRFTLGVACMALVGIFFGAHVRYLSVALMCLMAGKARGLPGAYVALFKKIDELGGISPDFATVAGYSASLREVQPIQNYFRDTLDLPEPLVRQIGCVIGTHAGPGAFGLAFFDKGLVLE